MTLFSSVREKRLWLAALLVLVAIYATLGFSGSLAGYVRDRNLLTPFFILGLFMVLGTILTHGLKTKPKGMEIVTGLGIVAAYLLLFTRISVPEDAHGHLVEYSLVAIFIYEALRERKNQGHKLRNPALTTLLIGLFLSFLDEGIQALLPSRVFDPKDLLFDILAVVFAIASSMLLTWIRQRINRE